METGRKAPFRNDDAFAQGLLRWHTELNDRNKPSSKSARARLRRCDDELEAMSERGSYWLLASLQPSKGRVDEAALLRLAPLLAWTELHDGAESLAGQLAASREVGGEMPRFSELRFKRLLESQGTELLTNLRRALALLDRKANVLSLAEAVCDWDDPDRGPPLRRRWAYDYYSQLPAAHAKA